MTQTHRLKLISFEICPFVERSRIALHEKGLLYDLQLVDLKAKPDWFLAISPMGKVPVLLVDDRPIFESLVINELLEELYPSPPLFPTEPLQRAEARAWMIFANDQLMMSSYKTQVALATGRLGEAYEPLRAVRAGFEKLEAQLEKRGGRFFLGNEFGLIDAVYAPYFRRWLASESWGELKLLREFKRLTAYADALLARPSVAKAAVPELSEKLRQFLRAKAA